MVESPSFVRRNVRWLVPGGIAAIAAAAWLAFGFFGVHTLFIDDEVAEADPFAVSAEAAPTEAAEVEAPAEATEAPATPTQAAEAPAGATEAPVEATEAAVPAGPTSTFQGSFISLDHPTSGTALIRTDGVQTFLRFEGFETDNGPDLNVYLSKAGPGEDPGTDYLDLGDLKGNIGEQNYEIPADVDLSEYRSVVIWCVRFGVGFGAAELLPL
jgi:hypothetical protein